MSKRETDLTPKQAAFLEGLPIGEEVHIATSGYSMIPIPSTGWKPRNKFTVQGLKSLIAKGYLEGETYWRGATVKRIR
jgi:hypothetical protein